LASGSGSITAPAASTVTDALDHDYEVTPGTYSAVETVPTEWDMTDNTCNDIVVGPGETKYCEITNVKKGKITIVKDADPNDCQNFNFTTSWNGPFMLDDDSGVAECASNDLLQSKTFDNLSANQSYAVTEAVEPNQYWLFKGIVCVNNIGESTYTPNGQSVSINLVPGGDITCTFTNEKLSPTRTLGFWQTHTAYTSTVFAGGMQIGSAPNKGLITNIQAAGQSQLFGGFYASIPKLSNSKTQRNALDKARMQLLQQLLAAKLNCAAFGCAASVQTMIATADSVYATGTTAQILTSAGLLGDYNNSGDTIIIGNAGSATPKVSQSLANIAFWDTP